MGFENPENPEEKRKASEIVEKLNNLFLDNSLQNLEKAIRNMGENTRDKLKRALAMAENKEEPSNSEEIQDGRYIKWKEMFESMEYADDIRSELVHEGSGGKAPGILRTAYGALETIRNYERNVLGLKRESKWLRQQRDELDKIKI